MRKFFTTPTFRRRSAQVSGAAAQCAYANFGTIVILRAKPFSTAFLLERYNYVQLSNYALTAHAHSRFFFNVQKYIIIYNTKCSTKNIIINKIVC